MIGKLEASLIFQARNLWPSIPSSSSQVSTCESFCAKDINSIGAAGCKEGSKIEVIAAAHNTAGLPWYSQRNITVCDDEEQTVRKTYIYPLKWTRKDIPTKREVRTIIDSKKRLFLWWDMWSFPGGSFSRNDSSWNPKRSRISGCSEGLFVDATGIESSSFTQVRTSILAVGVDVEWPIWHDWKKGKSIRSSFFRGI